jgi:hypothetical protein
MRVEELCPSPMSVLSLRDAHTSLEECWDAAAHWQAKCWFVKATLAGSLVPDVGLALAHTQLQSVFLSHLEVVVNNSNEMPCTIAPRQLR